LNAAELYTRELAKHIYDPLPYNIEREHLVKYQETHDESIRNVLVRTNLRFVVSVVKGFGVAGERVEAMDLIQEGNYGLIYSVPRYKIVNNCRLCSYSLHWIKFFARALVQTKDFHNTTAVDEVEFRDNPDLVSESVLAETAQKDLEQFLRQYMEPKEAYVLIQNFCTFDGAKKPKNLEEVAIELRCTAMNVLWLRKTGLEKLQKHRDEFEEFETKRIPLMEQ